MVRRRRLKGADARARILDAATERLGKVGPQGLRLADLAKELGISHQAILHHFGSRDGLVAEVTRRAIEGLQSELAAGIVAVEDHERGAAQMIERAYAVMVEQGYGRLLAHLVLSDPDHELDRRRPLQLLAQIAHLTRERNTERRHDPKDTAFTLMMLTYSLLGAAVFEEPLLVAFGLEDEPDTPAQYRAWLAALVTKHLEGEEA